MMSYDLFLICMAFAGGFFGTMVYKILNDWGNYKRSMEMGDELIVDECIATLKIDVVLLIVSIFLNYWLFSTHLDYVRTLFGI